MSLLEHMGALQGESQESNWVNKYSTTFGGVCLWREKGQAASKSGGVGSGICHGHQIQHLLLPFCPLSSPFLPHPTTDFPSSVLSLPSYVRSLWWWAGSLQLCALSRSSTTSNGGGIGLGCKLNVSRFNEWSGYIESCVNCIPMYDLISFLEIFAGPI